MFGKQSERGVGTNKHEVNKIFGYEIDRKILRQLKIIKLITENLPEGIMIFRPDGKIYYMNKFAQSLAHLRDCYKTAGGQSYTVCADENANEMRREDFPETRVLRGETLDNFIVQVLRPDKTLYLSYSGVPIYNNNKLVCAILSVHDITAQKKANAVLECNKTKLQDILDCIQDDFYILDCHWNFVYASKSIPSKIGKELKDIIGENFWEVFPKHIGTDFGENLRIAMANREMRRLIVGSKYSDAIYKKGIYPTEEGIIVIGTEVTDFKKTEQALYINEARIRAALSGSPIIMYSNDKELRYTWACNSAIGLSTEPVLGKKDDELFSPEDAAYFMSIKRNVIETGKGRRDEVVVHRHESLGGDMIYDLITEPLFDGTDEIVGVISTAIDITQPKRTEFELIKSQNAALALVEDLKAADLNKNAFLSALSHELRNPIAAVSAGLQMLDITTDKDLMGRTKDIIKRQMKQLCSLVDDLMDLSRINMNRIELKKELLELNNIAHLVSEDFKSQFEEKGVWLETEISKSVIYINADPVRVNQIIGNLLHNALKFTEAKHGRVLLKLDVEDGEAVVCVKDNGIGIDPEFLPNLFEPFKQAETSTDRKDGGLGIGLSIVKGMAELHGGSVYAASEGIGKGASFYIRLPVQQAPGSELKKEQHSQEANNIRVLVIDDNKDFAHILTQSLSLLGHSVDQAFDGFEGIQKVKVTPPDVILCDIGLPGMDGFEIARVIRSVSGLKDIILIALTGYATANDISRTLDAGFNHHLSKPVNLASLNEVLCDITRAKYKNKI